MAFSASGSSCLAFSTTPPVLDHLFPTSLWTATARTTSTAGQSSRLRARHERADHPWFKMQPKRGHRWLTSATPSQTELPSDTLWWGIGSPVQSLEVSCRHPDGQMLDPWRLSELMMDLGAMSVSVDDASLGSPEEKPIVDEPGASEAFAPFSSVSSATGRTEFWGGSSRIVGLFPGGWDLSGVVASIGEVLELSQPLVHHVTAVDNKDWIKSVQEGWEPIDVGRIRIRFPWHDALAPSERKPGQVELEVEGGGAFGTGEHPTTAMCLKWLEDTVSGKRVLDYGSGSGILGLVALKLGAVEAIGVELDVGAILSAAGNAERNGLVMDTYHPQEVGSNDEVDLLLTKVVAAERTGQLSPDAVSRKEAEKMASLAEGSAVRLENVGTFDVTVANILAAPLVWLEPVLARFTRPGGGLALSGILDTQAETVIEAYKEDFTLSVTETVGGWVLISGVRRGH